MDFWLEICALNTYHLVCWHFFFFFFLCDVWIQWVNEWMSYVLLKGIWLSLEALFPILFLFLSLFLKFSLNFHYIFFAYSLVGCTAPKSNSSIPCNGHGKCETKENGQSCLCYFGFTGPYCEHSKFLFSQRFASLSYFTVFNCVFFFALHFISDLNDCLPNPCKNNGMCLDGDGKFTCKCAPGWSG